MWVPLQRLLLRRHGSRANELADVLRRLAVEKRARATHDERAAAIELRALKLRVAAALDGVKSCGSCAAGKPRPRGVFAGGDCCTGVTSELFSDDEVAALAHGGTTSRDLHAPRTEHAGCAFRGAMGCTLSPGDRPERCVTYTCGTLRRELHARGILASTESMLAELHAAMQRFTALRRSRLDDELIGTTT
ncbi:MAG: hypothetical protein AB7T06_45630 [Kofleriaceae bacterium]